MLTLAYLYPALRESLINIINAGKWPMPLTMLNVIRIMNSFTVITEFAFGFVYPGCVPLRNPIFVNIIFLRVRHDDLPTS